MGSVGLGSRRSLLEGGGGPGSAGLMTFRKGPDGQDYFAVLGGAMNLIKVQEGLLAAERNFLAAKSYARASATRLVREEVRAEVAASGPATAAFAETRAKELLRSRILRPETSKGRHLEDAIVARSLPVHAYELGVVGIGDVSVLDSQTNNGGVYWRAIERGSDHLVGRELRGIFVNPGWGYPTGDEFRHHAEFIVGAGRKMVVENPIQGKHFLAQASAEALQFRGRIWQGIEASAIGQVEAIAKGTHPTLKNFTRRGFGIRPPR